MPADTTFSYNEIHQLYIRMSDLAGELLGSIHSVGQEAAKLKVLTMRLPPSLEEVWRDVLQQESGHRG